MAMHRQRQRQRQTLLRGCLQWTYLAVLTCCMLCNATSSTQTRRLSQIHRHMHTHTRTHTHRLSLFPLPLSRARRFDSLQLRILLHFHGIRSCFMFSDLCCFFFILFLTVLVFVFVYAALMLLLYFTSW